MKIAVVCNYTLNPNRIGGMDRFYLAFDEAVKSEGGTVDWFFPSSSRFEFYSGLNIIGEDDKDVKTVFLQHLEKDDNNYDQVITHFVELCTAFYKMVKAKTGAFVIAVDHNPRPLSGFPIKKRLINRLKGILYSRYIDRFIAVSDYTKREILKDYGSFLADKVFVVHNGIHTDIYQKRTEANKNKFLVVSHLRPSKGIQDLLEALGSLDEELLNKVKVDIYGEGHYEQQLRQLCETLKLNHVVNFKGSSSELKSLFQNYAYMIQPTYMECFSLSILESLASNVPVITTQVGGNLEVIDHGKNGFIFQAGDIGALLAILNDIVEGKIGIEEPVTGKIENRFNLKNMVKGHLKISRR